MSTDTDQRNYILNALPAVTVFVAVFFYRGIPFIDDAYFFFRYAENWANGFGPVYNVGEYVEGCSSFLWVALLAFGNFFGFEPIMFASFLNLFIGIANILLVTYFCDLLKISKSRLMPVSLSLFYALTHGSAYYALGGMDVLIFSLVLMLCLCSTYKSLNSGNYLTTLPFFLLLLLVRAEGFAYAIVIFAVFTSFIHINRRHLGTEGLFPIRFIMTTVFFVLMVIAVFLIRYSYYNEWVPLPVIAKGWASHSFKEVLWEGNVKALRDFLRVIVSGLKYEAPLLYLGAWIPFVVLLRRKDSSDFLLWLFAFCISLNVFVSVWAGGDFFPYKRHLLPVLPLLMIFMAWAASLFIRVCREKSRPMRYSVYTTMTIIALLWIGFFIRPSIISKKYIGIERTSHLQEVGELLAGLKFPTTLLSDMGGKLPYYAGPNVYVREMYGLTDIQNAKHGDVWCLIDHMGDSGTCGRTDYKYSFETPFDVFTYTSKENHRRFISFCRGNPSVCADYRYIHKKEWLDPPYIPSYPLRIIANMHHPAYQVLLGKPGAVALPVDENILELE
ncbi:MAG: hypothetical protein C4560_02440 [Nitrospiraceae bacterium]|nr:MAG: hypothetical protein C4560_02440 [Nitrospiraceae bacterium]